MIIGDEGIAQFDPTTGLPIRVATTTPSIGSADNILGGNARNILIGGRGSDVITGGDSNAGDVIIGDGGEAIFVNNIVTSIQTISPENGDRDIIDAGNGPDIVLGGTGGDLIDAGTDGSRDIVLGDNGFANFTDDGRIEVIASTDFAIGGDDDITVGDGDDLVIGGAGADAIDVDRLTLALVPGDSGDDIVIGDNGRATFFTDGGGQILTGIETIAPAVGARDLINTAAGSDIVIGGVGGDLIDAGTTNQSDIVIGDNGFAEFSDTGRLARIATTDTGIGGDDDITVGDGDDVVLGGFGSDAIDVDRATLATIGNDSGDDVVLGDNGEAVFFTGDTNRILTRIETTAPDDGARDLIFPANGSDIVIGGAGGDLINAGLDDSRDVIVGDGGVANFTNDGRIQDIATNAPAVGGDDDITCLLYTSPSPRDKRQSRMPSSA